MADYNIKDLLKKIINDGYRLKINYRLEKGRYVLFINYREMVNGKTYQKSKRVAILDGTRDSRKEDTEKIKLAIDERAKMEKVSSKPKDVFTNKADSVNVVDYITLFAEKANCQGSKENRLFIGKHVKAFSGEDTRFSHIDKKYCLDFKEYIERHFPASSGSWFKMFKQVLYKAIDDEIISDLPFLRKLSCKNLPTKRQFLSLDEIKLLNTSIEDSDYKNAFIFGCYTGLRFSDLVKLRFSDINDNRLSLVQQKTNIPLNILLHKVAIDIVEKQKLINKDYIFNLKSYPNWKNNINKMFKELNLNKKISGHCARHTFATSCLANGVDIYTLSKLLGHSSVKTTEIYLNSLDTTRDEAIAKLPDL